MAVVSGSMAKARTAAQQRVIDSALALIAQHGVEGTSLQMIANALGVTKAAVYHQFPSKEDIVVAAVEAPMADIASLVELAGAVQSDAARMEVAVDGFIDVVVRHRHVIGSLQGDPAMIRIVQDHPAYAELIATLTGLLAGGRNDAASLVSATMVLAAGLAAGNQPLLENVTDDELRTHLRAGARRLVGL